MQNFAIPTGIWINAGLLVAAAFFVWFKVSAEQEQPGQTRRPELTQSAGGEIQD